MRFNLRNYSACILAFNGMRTIGLNLEKEVRRVMKNLFRTTEGRCVVFKVEEEEELDRDPSSVPRK